MEHNYSQIKYDLFVGFRVSSCVCEDFYLVCWAYRQHNYFVFFSSSFRTIFISQQQYECFDDMVEDNRILRQVVLVFVVGHLHIERKILIKLKFNTIVFLPLFVSFLFLSSMSVLMIWQKIIEY
eukprot:TRINITY_DN5950_c0_g2_i1.p6 TRINITY_DN5950_c0_g2~~TRINITY_DN5950_c0_g2_i1.p6  ORF type:complete len:124 (-),score=3.32 TRINITY_DN5950_c0_g2_i1:21-392(-)